MVGYNEILNHVLNHKGNAFFVDGPGGTDKTYLYRALLAKVRSMGLITVATTTRVHLTGGNRSGLGRYQTGPNSKFKFEFKK